MLSKARRLLAVGVILTCSGLCMAQSAAPPANSQGSASTDTSLAGAARRAKAQKNARAKNVLTGDDLEETDGPLPRLNLDGEENADYVTTAIVRYHETHSPQQTEEVVHTWFDRYDQALASAIRDDLDLMAGRYTNTSNENQDCQQSQNSGRCEDQQMAGRRTPSDWSSRKRKDEDLIGRLQQSFITVRRGMRQKKFGYDWFKVRTADGVGSF